MTWTPDDVIKLVGTIGVVVATVINSVRGAAHGQAIATNSKQIRDLTYAHNETNSQLTAIALQTPPAAGSGNVSAPSAQ